MKDTPKLLKIFLLVVLFLFILGIAYHVIVKKQAVSARFAYFWKIASIDTMKYSRDISREKLHDPTFDLTISAQMNNIAKTGATHVAIGTPYDDEFRPILRRWVEQARRHNLKVWFRGNWSGWEKWFGYAPIDRKTHIEKTKKFITENADLFSDGDIFSACTECENGGPGDPRKTGDVIQFRKFILDEYQVTKNTFSKIHKNVASNYFSMNADVARIVMDPPTTKALDGIVTIDHYVATPEKLVADIHALAQESGGKVVLGEFGAPIPDIHGRMTEEEQASWIKHALSLLAASNDVVGVNYWVNVGGTTALWGGDGRDRMAVSEVRKVFIPSQIRGIVRDSWGNPIASAHIESSMRYDVANTQGNFALPTLKDKETLVISSPGFASKAVTVTSQHNVRVTLDKDQKGIFLRLKKFFNL